MERNWTLITLANMDWLESYRFRIDVGIIIITIIIIRDSRASN